MREIKRRWLRRFAVVGGVSALILIALFVITWFQLPSISDMMNGLRAIKPVAPVTTTVATAASTPAPLPSPTPVAAAATPLPRPDNPNSAVVTYVVDRFVRGDGAVRVCSSWPNLATAAPRTPGAFGEMLQQQSQGNVPENAYLESALASLGGVLRMPNVGQVVQRMQTAASTNDPTLANNDQFRSQLALASADIVANRAALEAAAQHAYHLYVLSRAVSMNPALASDANAQALCTRLESLAIQPQAIQPQDMDAEKALVLRVLGGAGISPDQVGFDPDMRNTVRAVANASGVSVTVPWVFNAFGSSMRITNTMAGGSVSGATSAP